MPNNCFSFSFLTARIRLPQANVNRQTVPLWQLYSCVKWLPSTRQFSLFVLIQRRNFLPRICWTPIISDLQSILKLVLIVAAFQIKIHVSASLRHPIFMYIFMRSTRFEKPILPALSSTLGILRLWLLTATNNENSWDSCRLLTSFLQPSIFTTAKVQPQALKLSPASKYPLISLPHSSLHL